MFYYGIRKQPTHYVIISSEHKEGLIQIFKCVEIFEDEAEAKEYLEKMNRETRQSDLES